MWRRAHSRAQSLRLRRLLAQTTPTERRAGVVVVSIVREIAPMFEASRGALEQALFEELGERVRVEVAPDRGDGARPASGVAPSQHIDQTNASDPPGGERRQNIERVEDHPLVRSAIELFNAEIVDVRPLNPASE